MKTLFSSFLIICLCSSFECGKDDLQLNTTCVPGKIVQTTCASTVVQIIDPAFYTLGEDNWVPLGQTQKVDHVFTVGNKCALPASRQLQVNDTVYFKVISNRADSSCVVCMMYDKPPVKTLSIALHDAPCEPAGK
jgi:hypothetical protein